MTQSDKDAFERAFALAPVTTESETASALIEQRLLQEGFFGDVASYADDLVRPFAANAPLLTH